MSAIAVARRSMLGGAAAALASPARAQGSAWPDRPIRIVVPLPPGAFNDALARLGV